MLTRRTFIASVAAAAGAAPAILRAQASDDDATTFVVDFDIDRDEITTETAATLDRVALVMARHPGSQLKIQAHVDQTGGGQHMVSIAQRLANNVRAYLASRGVPDGTMISESFGSSQPAVDAPGGIDRRNRRVLILIAFPGTPQFDSF